MIGPNSLPNSSLSPAFRVAAASAELRAGGAAGSERFGDFAAFAMPGEGQVGLGRATSSIDVDHAARQVADFITEAWLVALKADPDWIGAAQSLVAALEAQKEPEGRVEVIDAVRGALGDAVYPGFVKLLAAVARFGDLPARKLVADAFAEALSTSKLPSVRVPAWGGGLSSRLPPGLGGGALLSHLRSVGPIEFLCLWACRDIANETLDPESFEIAIAWLLKLFDASPRAAVLYQARLSTDLESPVEGLHDRDTRAIVRALVEAWEGGAEPAAVARTARQALKPSNPFAALGR